MAETLTYYGLVRAHLSRMGPNVLPSVLAAIGMSSFDTANARQSVDCSHKTSHRTPGAALLRTLRGTYQERWVPRAEDSCDLSPSLSLSLYIYIRSWIEGSSSV